MENQSDIRNTKEQPKFCQRIKEKRREHENMGSIQNTLESLHIFHEIIGSIHFF